MGSHVKNLNKINAVSGVWITLAKRLLFDNLS